jgi:hypothetical protein
MYGWNMRHRKGLSDNGDVVREKAMKFYRGQAASMSVKGG